MLKRLGGWILNLDNVFAAISLVLVISVTTVGVFMRFVLDDPLKWTEEVTLALFVWFIFLGASVVTKEDGHVGIDYFVEKLNPSLKRISLLCRELVVGVINIYVFVYLGSQLALQATTKLTPILRISYLYIDISVVLCGIFSTIHIISRIMKIIRNEKKTIKLNKKNDFHTSYEKGAKL